MYSNNSEGQFDAVNSFFEAYTLEEAREFLWDWTIMTFEKSGNEEWRGREVADLLTFQKKINELITFLYE